MSGGCLRVLPAVNLQVTDHNTVLLPEEREASEDEVLSPGLRKTWE